jgi:hypothetical protein
LSGRSQARWRDLPASARVPSWPLEPVNRFFSSHPCVQYIQHITHKQPIYFIYKTYSNCEYFVAPWFVIATTDPPLNPGRFKRELRSFGSSPDRCMIMKSGSSRDGGEPNIRRSGGRTMCGRFTLIGQDQFLAREFGVSDIPLLLPRYNIAPSQHVTAVRASSTGSGREIAFLRWGLIPSWSKDPALGNRLINARAETAQEKPSFRNAFRRHRCLIPASGFYEWQRQDRGKQPYYIRMYPYDRRERRPGTDPRPDAGDHSSGGIQPMARSGTPGRGVTGVPSCSVPTGRHARFPRESPCQCTHRRRRDMHSPSTVTNHLAFTVSFGI